MKTYRLALGIVALLLPAIAFSQSYDVVIRGGRVLDPETGLDAVRDIGISNGKVQKISAEPLAGKRTIAASGLVVAPGFIDLHQHAQDLDSQRVKALDGVTTALELEIGKPDVAEFLHEREGRSLIHYGTAASHAAARALAFGNPLPGDQILPRSGPATDQPATAAQMAAIEARMRHEFDAGALAVGMGLQYTPGATRLEVIQMFRLAAGRHLPVYTHIRSAGVNEPGSSIEAVEEVIGSAAVSGAPLHIVHINSSCGGQAPECLGLIAGARARGLDVTTEAYPYEAGMTAINSALFNPGWQEKFGVTYGDLMLPETGERLTRKRFELLHNSAKEQLVVMFSNKMANVDGAILNPLVMIASDGEKGHPRNAGTYSRVISRYVRDQRTLSLMDAVRKMS
ncbi:MAG: D-glutamate deacylase, partial [Acidobacteria bacterium]|nr:D-glutamate deacylase [Acidobacteriota bacterium]